MKWKIEYLILWMVGLVFLSEGIQKWVTPEITGVGRFTKIGIPYPDVMAYLIGTTEIFAGLLLIFRIGIRYVSIALLVIMLGAIWFTKVSMFAEKGFWTTLHEGRTDFLMTMSLIYLLMRFWKKNS